MWPDVAAVGDTGRTMSTRCRQEGEGGAGFRGGGTRSVAYCRYVPNVGTRVVTLDEVSDESGLADRVLPKEHDLRLGLKT